MKKQLHLLAISFLITTGVFTQSVGIGTTTPNSSARLEIAAASKGLLIPRVVLSSETDVTTVPAPATSLMVYNTGNALPDGAGYYYWSGTKWLKLLTNTEAGGELGGNYPNPVLTKLLTKPLPTTAPTFDETGKVLRYNMSLTGMWEYSNPVESYEIITPASIRLGTAFGTPGTVTRSADGASLLPLCYGNYSSLNTLTGQTGNVSVVRVSTGRLQFTVTPASFGNAAFNPVFACTITGDFFGYISARQNGNGLFVVETRSPSTQAFIDYPFSFTVYNR